MKTVAQDWLRVCLLMAVVGLLWLWPLTVQPDAVPFWPGADYSDLLVSHYPNAVMVHDAWTAYHQIPLWNPTILSGTPANADPLVGLWYPLRWVGFVFPSVLTFNVLTWLHLVLAGVGVYALTRHEGTSKNASLAAGFIFMGIPKLMAHTALGHIDLLAAIGWTPWALLGLRSLLGRIASKASPTRASILFGVSLGMVFLADPRWLLPVVLACFIYAAFSMWAWLRDRSLSRSSGKSIGISIVMSGGAAFLTAAPLALPLLQYVSYTTRRFLSAAEQGLYALPAPRLLGLFLPFHDIPEWVIYCGPALSLLVIAGFFLRRRATSHWVAIGCFFLILAIGPATPLHSWMAALPGMDLLRVPARLTILVALAFTVISAHGLDGLVDQSVLTGSRKWLNLIAVGWVSVLIILGTAFFLGREGGVVSVLQVVVSGVGGLALILGRRRLLQQPRIYPGLWLALIGFDLLIINSQILEPQAMSWDSPPAWLQSVEHEGWGDWRTFSPSFSLQQDQAAVAHLEMADGVHPLQRSDYFAFMAGAVGYSADDYSVTLPPYPNGDPSQAWPVNLDLQKLGLLSVEYIVSDYPLDSPALAPIAEGPFFVYKNPEAMPRAWVEPQSANEVWRPVEDLTWSPNRISLEASGPARLVLSELLYPGWIAQVDGERVDIQPYAELLRSVDLGPGRHRVEFLYQPVWTWIGLAGWAVLILSLSIQRIKS